MTYGSITWTLAIKMCTKLKSHKSVILGYLLERWSEKYENPPKGTDIGNRIARLMALVRTFGQMW